MSLYTWKALLLMTVILLTACGQATPTAAPAKATAAPAAPTVAPAAATSAPATTKPAAAAATAPAAQPTPAAKIKRGGTMIFSRNNIIDDLDSVSSITFSPPVGTMVYEHLVSYDITDRAKGTWEFKPFLAESWEYKNPTTIIMKLRKGVKFSDGSDFTAEVAKWNLERTRDYVKSEGKHLAENIAGVEIVDASTIQINLKKASATMLIKLSNGGVGTASAANAMASKAAVDKGGPEALRDNPIGTGPMVLDSWLRGDRVTLKKRTGYWMNGEDGQPLPYLDGITDRYIPDSAVAFVEVRSGNIQAAQQVSLSDVASVRSNPDLVWDERPWAGTLRFAYAVNQTKGPFATNQKLRQALHYAIDKEQMAKTMGFGLARPARYYYWTPTTLGWDESITRYDYDVAKAKQVMAEAGYPGGIDVPLTTIARDPDRKISEIAKFMWDAVGIRTTIDSMERAAGLAAYRAGNATVGFYGLTMYGDPDLFSIRDITCTGLNNWFGYCNKDLDACIAEGGTTLETPKRNEIYKRCLKIFMEDAYLQGGYMEPNYVVLRKEVKGLTTHWTDYSAKAAWLDK